MRLARLVGAARAKEMLFLGEPIDAVRALEWGLVNRIADGTSALATARGMAGVIAANGPLSNRFAKELVDASQDDPIDAALSRATTLQQAIFDSEDLHEGARAFLEKRAAAFKGR